MKPQILHINVVRSAWRRVKKEIKDAIIRDLKPVKDVKGGGGVAGQSKPTKGGTGTRAPLLVTDKNKESHHCFEAFGRVEKVTLLLFFLKSGDCRKAKGMVKNESNAT